jgi:predicted metal-binding membrane protein
MVSEVTGGGHMDRLLVAVGRRDRRAAIVVLAFGSIAAWLYLAVGFSSQAGMGAAMVSMTTMGAWTVSEAGVRLLMWAVMMVAMMLPAAIAPTLVYVAVARKASKQGTPVASALALVSGYIGVWLVFCVAATTAQWGLDRLNLLSASMASNNALFGGSLLIIAGLYQMTPLKARCLKLCRDPARLLADHWHAGSAGAVQMGAELGVYCLGCCWVLMALLFVGGVMNLVWVAAIATFILLEKTAPNAEMWGRVLGAAMIVAGVAIIALA